MTLGRDHQARNRDSRKVPTSMDLIAEVKADVKYRAHRGIALRERVGTLTNDQLWLLITELTTPELRAIETAARRNGGATARMPYADAIFQRIGEWDDAFTGRVWTVAKGVAAATGDELSADSRYLGALEALNAYWVAVMIPEAFTPKDQAALKAPFLRILGEV